MKPNIVINHQPSVVLVVILVDVRIFSWSGAGGEGRRRLRRWLAGAVLIENRERGGGLSEEEGGGGYPRRRRGGRERAGGMSAGRGGSQILFPGPKFRLGFTPANKVVHARS